MNMRNLAVWGLIAVLLLGLLAVMQSNPAQAGAQKVDISEIYDLAEQKQLAEVNITPTKVTAVTTNNERIYAQKSQDLGALRERMIEANQTQIEVDEPEEDSMSLLMGAETDKPVEDDMSEEKLLRALMDAQGQR